MRSTHDLFVVAESTGRQPRATAPRSPKRPSAGRRRTAAERDLLNGHTIEHVAVLGEN